jgi:GGDEF domain-containing protein
MDVFDKVNRKTLDRHDQQLSILALIMVVILGAGMALLMYPMVFGKTAMIQVAPSRTLFYAFCVLCLLMVAYLIDRMFVVRNLRTTLIEEREQLAQVLQQSSAELLGTLMGFSHFQDRLAMNFRRATQASEPLSLLLVHIKPSKMFARGPQAQVALGDAAKVLSRKLRGEDSLYRLSSELFGIMLPGATNEAARQTADRLSEGLADASGASNRYTTDIQVVSYPDHVNSASEMERRAAAMVNQD